MRSSRKNAARAVWPWLVLVAAAPGCEISREVLSPRGGQPGPDGGAADDALSNLPGGDAGPFGPPVILDVNFGMRLRAVSPRIYGLATERFSGPMASLRPGMLYFASFWSTTYNWENNAGNGGATWCWENGAPFGGTTSGGAMTALLGQAKNLSASALVTIPIGDYVAADTMGGGGPPACSADVRLTPNFLDTRFRKNVARKGRTLSFPPNLDDDSVYQDEFASFLQGSTGPGEITFALDFMPERWAGIFAALHPERLTYRELAQRDISFAGAIKAVMPGARIMASSVDGWTGMMDLNGASDSVLGVFMEFLLDEMKKAADTAGRRVIDQITLAWSPVLPAGSQGEEVLRDARLQAPRSLWDPTYVERSWIAQRLQGPVQLIPFLREMIAQHYPGTGIAFHSWNYGAGDKIEGALVVADVLGVFAREGIDVATLNIDPGRDTFAMAGWKAMRNFDGKGGAFGDTVVAATASDPRAASIHASLDSKDPSRVVVVVVNKSTAVLPIELRSDGPTAFSTAEVLRVTAAVPAPLGGGEALGAVSPNLFRDALPPLSITIFVLQP